MIDDEQLNNLSGSNKMNPITTGQQDKSFDDLCDSESYTDDDRNDEEMVAAVGQKIQNVLNTAYRSTSIADTDERIDYPISDEVSDPMLVGYDPDLDYQYDRWGVIHL